MMNDARRVGKQEDAIADWCREVRAITQGGRSLAEQVVEEQSEDYTVGETGRFLQEFGECSQKLEALLTVSATALSSWPTLLASFIMGPVFSRSSATAS